jgi:hypothetical protein
MWRTRAAQLTQEAGSAWSPSSCTPRWSGLTLTGARAGLEANRSALASVVVDGWTYWLDPAAPEPPSALVDLPWIIDPAAWRDTFYRPVLIGGRRAGTWRRRCAAAGVIAAAAGRYTAFLGQPDGLVGGRGIVIHLPLSLNLPSSS